MKLTSERVSRYLTNQRHLNDYLLKITTKDREALILLSQARGDLLTGEQGLRKLNEYLVNEVK